MFVRSLHDPPHADASKPEPRHVDDLRKPPFLLVRANNTSPTGAVEFVRNPLVPLPFRYLATAPGETSATGKEKGAFSNPRSDSAPRRGALVQAS
jgi:hypothetical protein